jgi:AcrR family transcriptional regulator
MRGVTTPTSPAPNRGARRRARTRAQLLDAARELFAMQGVEATRVGDITERADVGAGSFYNHFTDKDAIVEAILADAAEQQGQIVDLLSAALDDPAEVMAVAHRHFVRLAQTDPTFALLVVRLDLTHRLMTTTLGPRATRDLRSGIAAGRFDVADLGVALHAMGGALLGVMRAVIDGAVGEDADVLHAEGVLRALGVPKAQAARIARRPMPVAVRPPASAAG